MRLNVNFQNNKQESPVIQLPETYLMFCTRGNFTMNKMPHIQLDQSIHTTAAILPGDPARVDAIAAFLEDVKEEGFSREYKSITGTYKGRRILAISTGMGGASTAICVEELADLGVTDLIRIGSCGALQSHLLLGQLVICDRAVCDDGTSQTYLHALHYAAEEINRLPEFNPASNFNANHHTDDFIQNCEHAQHTSNSTQNDDHIPYAHADSTLTTLCVETAKELQLSYAVGPTRCHDALYLKTKPLIDEVYSRKGVFASDMETAALFAVGMLRGVRTASILNTVVEWKKNLKEGISSYKNGEDATAAGERNEILLALETLARV